MEDWQKHLRRIVTTAGLEIEHFVKDINEALTVATIEIAEALESAVGEVRDVFLESEDRDFDDWEITDREDRENNTDRFDLDFDSYSIEEDIGWDGGYYDVYHLEPSEKRHRACIGCCHYHGMVYNGNLLVCAMHPEGSQDNNCPDWEQ